MARGTIDDLQKSVEAYDRCWVEGRTDDLRQFLHPNVVFTGPQFERLASGVDACVKTYEGFLAQAKVHDFAASQHVIDVAGDCAVVTYRWTIDYEFEGASSQGLRPGPAGLGASRRPLVDHVAIAAARCRATRGLIALRPA